MPPLSHLMPVLCVFKGDRHSSSILYPNAGHYRWCGTQCVDQKCGREGGMDTVAECTVPACYVSSQVCP